MIPALKLRPAENTERPEAERRSPRDVRMTAVVEDGAAGLEKHLAAWENLAAAAIEPNVFYEPWMVLPALMRLRRNENLLFVLIFAEAENRVGPPVLCGFFPIERTRRYKMLPIRAVRLWKHVHCFLCSPLIRAEYAAPCLKAFFDWVSEDPRGATIVELGDISGDGPLWKAVAEFFEGRKEPSLVLECYTRALLRPLADSNVYIETALSTKKRRALHQQEEQLGKLGALQYVTLAGDGDIDAWLVDFLRLEASGWKGRAGTALACNEPERLFFLDCMRAAFRHGRLMMLALCVDGRPIAQLCNFLCRRGSFAFKVAFDEAYARYSPGVLLELENIAQIHRQPWIRWQDSCSGPGPALTKQLWLDRRIVQTILVTTGKAPGPLFISLLPILQWLFQAAAALPRRLRRR